jgi:outer membrane protein assembly factor BamB
MVGRRAVGLLLTILLVSACGWPMDRFGATRTGYNPLETVIGTDDVGDLELQWSASLGTDIDVPNSPVVVNDIVIIGREDGNLEAFNALGATNCSGSPSVCLPLWTASAGGPIVSTPGLGFDNVYVGSSYGTLSAFSTSGTTNCSGSPKVCAPLWTASTGGEVSSPLVVGGVVYVTSVNDRLYAFDANGSTGCSGTPRTCQPLWTAPVERTTTPPRPAALADGVVYVTSGTTLHAFDAAGVTGCSGSPTTCSPLWTAPTRSECGAVCFLSGPAVDGGTVYVGANRGDEFPVAGSLYAFDAAGQVNCSGQPRTCQPEWTAITSSQFGAPAVAEGVVYVTDYYQHPFNREPGGQLLAFDAAGVTNCGSGSCSPLWAANIGRVTGSPSVANGVVYVVSGGNGLLAFDAAGQLGCSGAPATCTPLWTYPVPDSNSSSPTLADGRVYLAEREALRVFGLPPATP